MTTPSFGDAASASAAPTLNLLSEVDTWLVDMDLSSLSPLAASPVRASPSRVASPLPPPPPPAKPMNSTQRRKEELQRLRTAVPELEARLNRLKRAARHPPTTLCSDSMWKGRAKRQRIALATANEERQRLLALVHDQAALIQGLEALLGDRQVWDPVHASRKKTGAQTSDADAWKYESLLRSIDARYPMLETVFRSPDLGSLEPRRGYIKLLDGRSDGISMETRHRTLLPFDHRTTAETVWQAIRRGELNYFDDVTVVEEEEHQVLTKLMIVQPPIVNRPTAVHQAFKLYDAGSSTHVMWEMTVLTSGSAGNPSMRVNVQGWGRLSPATVADGQLGSELEEFARMTVCGVEQEAETETSQSPRRSISSLSGLIVSVYQQRHEIAHQKMENLLLDTTVHATPPDWRGVSC